MKSLSVSVFWPCWEWLSDPSITWLYASYTQPLATRDAVKARRLIQSQGRKGATTGTLLERVGYQGLLRLLGHDWQITSDQNVKTRYENDRTGYRISASFGGSVTGDGGDRRVIDDPHKPDEVASDVVRESDLDWYDQTWSSRGMDPKTDAQVLIMQRLHELDLTGHLVEKGGWEHVCLPAEYEPQHPFVWPDDPRTEPGDLLWPERMTEKFLREQEIDLGSYGYAGQMQQRPAPEEGGILKRAWWEWYDPTLPVGSLPDFTQVIQSWDMAFKDTEDSAFVVGQVWGKFKGEKYLLRQTRAKMEFTETVEAVRDLTGWVESVLPGHRGHLKLVEDKANGPAIISSLRREIPGLLGVDPRGDKEARAQAIAPEIEAGNVYLPGYANADHTDYDPSMTPLWVKQLVDECASFPNAAYKDQVDALSQALLRLAGTGGGKPRGERGTMTGGMGEREF